MSRNHWAPPVVRRRARVPRWDRLGVDGTLGLECRIVLWFPGLLTLSGASAAPVHLAVCDRNTAVYLGHISDSDDSSPLEPFSPAIPPRFDALETVTGVSWQLVQVDRGDAGRTLSSPRWSWVNSYLADQEPEPCTSNELCLERRVDLGACEDPHGTLYASSRLRRHDQPIPEDSPERGFLDREAERSGMVVVHTQQLTGARAALTVATEPKADGSPRAALILQGDWQAQIPVSHWMGPETHAAPMNIRNQMLLVEIFGGERSGWMIVTPTPTGFTLAPMWSRLSHD